MPGLEQDLLMERQSVARQWAAGAVRALATIALSALVVWIAVSVINDSGLLRRPAPAPEHSPAGGTQVAQIAYG